MVFGQDSQTRSRDGRVSALYYTAGWTQKQKRRQRKPGLSEHVRVRRGGEFHLRQLDNRKKRLDLYPELCRGAIIATAPGMSKRREGREQTNASVTKGAKGKIFH